MNFLKKMRFVLIAVAALVTFGTVVYAHNPGEIDFYTSVTYRQYIQSIIGDNMPQPAGAQVVIDASNYSWVNIPSELAVYDNFEGMDGATLIIGDGADVEWTFDVPVSGFYSIEVLYFPVAGRGNAIERRLAINGEVPFREASIFSLSRIWANAAPMRQDGRGNDIRPQQIEVPTWRTQFIYDSLGFYNNPLLFYFEAGQNTIQFASSREPVAIRSIIIGYHESAVSYSQWIGAQSAQPILGGLDAAITIQAQDFTAKSDFTIYAINDRTSSITYPQDPSLLRLNALGGYRWQLPHQWVSWTVDVPQAGLYRIAIRYLQNQASGRFSNRRLSINGEVQFYEANNLQFIYSNNWQVLVPGDDDGYFLFYFEEGENEIVLEIVLGEMADVVSRVNNIVSELNLIYRNILMITGPDPDLNRDYFFNRLIPDEIENMYVQAQRIREIRIEMTEITGTIGSEIGILNRLAFQLEAMHDDYEEIARNFVPFRDNIAAFASWALTLTMQPVVIDYIMLLPQDADVPRAEAGFFANLWFNVMSFIRTFFTDFNTLGSDLTAEEMRDVESLEVWIATGRDQMQILRNMINDSFTPVYGVNVDLKLVADGTLLPSILAGVGPDVALSNPGTQPVQFGLRNATLPLNDFPGFDEVVQRFHPSAMMQLELEGQYFGLPETQIFPMMFYRSDILRELDLEPPETWEDFYRLIARLQRVNMQVGFPSGIDGLMIFLYQQGGELFTPCRMRSTLDDDLTVEAFMRQVELFTTFRLPRDVDIASRFRTGEMPVLIANYDFYNMVVAFAPEIRGMWNFTRLPGTVMPDGTINYTSPTGGSAVMMLNGTDMPYQAWQFMTWFTDADAQSRFGQEMQAILGPAAKQPTANMEALAAMPWSQDEYRRLMQQFQMIQGTPEVPGGYYVGRAFAFSSAMAYNDGDPEAILTHVRAANREITRRRLEFGLEVYD